jgi:hypothetical protein
MSSVADELILVQSRRKSAYQSHGSYWFSMASVPQPTFMNSVGLSGSAWMLAMRSAYGTCRW